ncbi:hypothetical protein Tco_0824652 [Tanacetum coccineum]|uniref:Nucleotide-binding alpha-beta plait domain-containing protein n=1 Tax=Tanacetum coccineum TaxID=301880 RepID=A0ABQ5AQP1_9ASTR
MFMVQRRLRNGKRYGFVRYKFVRDVDGLLKQLQRIRFGEEWLRVFVAYNRRRYNDGVAGAEGGGHGNKYKNMNNVGVNENGGISNNRDTRRFVDVVNSGCVKGADHKLDKSSKADENHTCIRNKDVNWVGNMTANKEGFDIHLEQKAESVRCIEIEYNEVNSELMGRSVVGEVKAHYFLTKLSVLCEEQGLDRFKIKLLWGLEVMVVMENIETADNVLKDREHGLRRWLHNLRLEGRVMSDHVSKVGGVAEDKMGEKRYAIDKGVGEDDGESNSEGSGGSSDEEGEDEDKGSEDEENRGNKSDMNFGNQNGGEDL